MRPFALVGMLAVACAEGSSGGEETGAGPAIDDGVADWVTQLEGTWFGAAETPIGSMPFAMVGERTPDGVRTSIEQMGLRIVLDFASTPEGWRLTERGELPGGFVQEHELTLSALDGDETRWTSIEAGLMDIVTRVSEDEWTFAVDVRGAPHASWVLARQ